MGKDKLQKNKSQISTGLFLAAVVLLTGILVVCGSSDEQNAPRYQTLVETGTIDSARTVLEQIVTANPDDADALLYLGMAHAAGGDWMGAIGSGLRAAAELDSTDWRAGYFLTVAYDKIGRYDESLHAFRTYVAGRKPGAAPRDTSYAALAAAKVRLLFSRNAKDLDRIAAMSLKEYAQHAPGSPELLPLMAEAAYKTEGTTVAGDKMQRRAYELLRKKVKRAGLDKDLLLLDARFRDSRDARKQACEKGMRDYPDEPRFYIIRGYDQLQYVDSDGALASFKKALELRPEYVDALVGTGIALLNTGKGKEAVEVLRKAVTLDPASAIAHYNLGVAYGKLRRGDDAITEYRKAIVLDPQYVDALYNLGRLYYLYNKFALSQATLERVLILEPTYAEAAVIIANIMIKNQKLDEAWEIMKSVLRHDPDNEVIKMNLAKIPHHIRSDK